MLASPTQIRSRMAPPALVLLLAPLLAGPALTACGDGDTSPDRDTVDSTSADTAPEVEDTTTSDTTTADTAPGDTAPPPPPPAGRLVINEVECRADPVEWVEVKNVGDAPLDVTGYRVADAPSERGVRLPAATVPPGSYMIVTGDIGLACDRDEVFLIGGGKVVDVAPARRGDPELATWGRFPDGEGDFRLVAPTPQKANRALDDERATLFVGEGTMPVVDLFVDAEAEAILEGPRAWAPALLTWTDERGTSPPQRVDIRIKGAITDRPWRARPSLKVHFARHDAPGPRALRGVKKLALHAMVYDPSTVREWLAYEVLRRMGVPAPRVGWASVRVNGQPKGLYGVIESYDEIFLADHFPSTVALYEADGDLYPGLGGIFLDEGDSMAPVAELAERVAQVIYNHAEPTRALPEIDWRQLALFVGVEDVRQHTDGMKSGCHNYYLHVGDEGLWSFMAWSVDLTLIPQYGAPGPIGSCNQLALLCDRDPRCVTWFGRARDQAAQLVLREDLRTPAVARATRNQAYADRTREPWTGNDFWPDVAFDLPALASDAVDLLETRARGVRCATAAERGIVDEADPTCAGFVGEGGGKPEAPHARPAPANPE
ncbi:MAG: CotH kinase family protein [Deltaproteobacteria bacterium]|nr:CotH kinase family protein [Deltaproteobacteria bacterium]